MCCIPAQSCPTLSWFMGCSLPGSSVHEITRGKNTGVSSHFPSRGYSQSDPCLLHCHLGGPLLHGFGQCVFIVPITIGAERIFTLSKNSWSSTIMPFTLTLLIPAINDLFTISIVLSFSECQLVRISKNFILEIGHFLSLLCLSLFP